MGHAALIPRDSSPTSVSVCAPMSLVGPQTLISKASGNIGDPPERFPSLVAALYAGHTAAQPLALAAVAPQIRPAVFTVLGGFFYLWLYIL